MADLSTEVLLAGVVLVGWLCALVGFFVGVLLSTLGRWSREDEAQRMGDAGPTVDERGRRV